MESLKQSAIDIIPDISGQESQLDLDTNQETLDQYGNMSLMRAGEEKIPVNYAIQSIFNVGQKSPISSDLKYLVNQCNNTLSSPSRKLMFSKTKPSKDVSLQQQQVTFENDYPWLIHQLERDDKLDDQIEELKGKNRYYTYMRNFKYFKDTVKKQSKDEDKMKKEFKKLQKLQEKERLQKERNVMEKKFHLHTSINKTNDSGLSSIPGNGQNQIIVPHDEELEQSFLKKSPDNPTFIYYDHDYKSSKKKPNNQEFSGPNSPQSRNIRGLLAKPNVSGQLSLTNQRFFLSDLTAKGANVKDIIKRVSPQRFPNQKIQINYPVCMPIGSREINTTSDHSQNGPPNPGASIFSQSNRSSSLHPPNTNSSGKKKRISSREKFKSSLKDGKFIKVLKETERPDNIVELMRMYDSIYQYNTQRLKDNVNAVQLEPEDGQNQEIKESKDTQSHDILGIQSIRLGEYKDSMRKWMIHTDMEAEKQINQEKPDINHKEIMDYNNEAIKKFLPKQKPKGRVQIEEPMLSPDEYIRALQLKIKDAKQLKKMMRQSSSLPHIEVITPKKEYVPSIDIKPENLSTKIEKLGLVPRSLRASLPELPQEHPVDLEVQKTTKLYTKEIDSIRKVLKEQDLGELKKEVNRMNREKMLQKEQNRINQVIKGKAKFTDKHYSSTISPNNRVYKMSQNELAKDPNWKLNYKSLYYQIDSRAQKEAKQNEDGKEFEVQKVRVKKDIYLSREYDKQKRKENFFDKKKDVNQPRSFSNRVAPLAPSKTNKWTDGDTNATNSTTASQEDYNFGGTQPVSRSVVKESLFQIKKRPTTNSRKDTQKSAALPQIDHDGRLKKLKEMMHEPKSVDILEKLPAKTEGHRRESGSIISKGKFNDQVKQKMSKMLKDQPFKTNNSTSDVSSKECLL